MNEEKRITYYRALTGILLAITIAFTWQLWSGDRTFPTAPLFGIHSYLAGFQGLVFKISLIIAALLFAFNIQFSEWLLGLLLMFGFADDLNRLRPDFYHYLIIAAFFALSRIIGRRDLVQGFKIICAGIYIWTGIQKINPGFVQHAPDFFYTAFHIQNHPAWVNYLILLIPLLEILIGLLFIFARQIPCALFAASVLHIIIVIQLCTAHWNLTLIPYNLFLLAGNFILFLPEAGKSVSPFTGIGFLPKTAVILFIVLPAFNWAHLWPNYMSAGMYSYKGPFASVSVDEDLRKKLPEVAQKVIYHSDKGDYLPFNYWDHAESGCIPNAEGFVYRKIFKQIQAKYNTTDSVQLYVY